MGFEKVRGKTKIKLANQNRTYGQFRETNKLSDFSLLPFSLLPPKSTSFLFVSTQQPQPSTRQLLRRNAQWGQIQRIPKTSRPRAVGRQTALSTARAARWLQGLAWPIVVDLANSSPPPACRCHGSPSQVTVSPIPRVVSDGSSEKWLEHSGGLVHDFD